MNASNELRSDAKRLLAEVVQGTAGSPNAGLGLKKTGERLGFNEERTTSAGEFLQMQGAATLEGRDEERIHGQRIIRVTVIGLQQNIENQTPLHKKIWKTRESFILWALTLICAAALGYFARCNSERQPPSSAAPPQQSAPQKPIHPRDSLPR